MLINIWDCCKLTAKCTFTITYMDPFFGSERAITQTLKTSTIAIVFTFDFRFIPCTIITVIFTVTQKSSIKLCVIHVICIDRNLNLLASGIERFLSVVCPQLVCFIYGYCAIESLGFPDSLDFTRVNLHPGIPHTHC